MRSDLPYMSPGPGPAHWTLLGKPSRGWPSRGRAIRGLRDTQKNRLCCHTDRGRQRQPESAAGAYQFEYVSGGIARQRAAENRAELGSKPGQQASSVGARCLSGAPLLELRANLLSARYVEHDSYTPPMLQYCATSPCAWM